MNDTNSGSMTNPMETPMTERLHQKIRNNLLDSIEKKLPKHKAQTKYLGVWHSLIQGHNNCLDEVKAIIQEERDQ